MSWTDLKERVGVSDDFNDAYIEQCYDVATSLVDQALDGAFRAVPTDTLNMLYVEVGANLFDRKNSPSSNSQFVEYAGSAVPIRSPRDPLTSVMPIIRRYVVPL